MAGAGGSENSGDSRGVRWLKSLWSLFLEVVTEDWDAFFVMLGMVVLAVVALLAPEPNKATVRFWVAAACPVLVVLVVVMIRTRRTTTREQAAVQGLIASSQDIFDGTRTVLDQLKAEPLLKQEREFQPSFLANASRLDLLGITLGRSVGDNISRIVDVLSKGGRVRILISEVNPQLEAEFPRRFRNGRAGGQTLQARITGTMDSIETIIERATECDARGELNVGRLPFFTPCGVVVVGREDGRDVRCEIYHQSSTENQTAFYLYSGTGAEATMTVFEQTFESYWRVSQHVKMFPSAAPKGTVGHGSDV